MLILLRFENLGLLRRTEIPLGGGLCALTGESGSGKSLILSGLGLLLGKVRTRLKPGPFGTSGLVEAEFDITAPVFAELRERLRGLGLPDESPLVLARRLTGSGRTRSFVQGQLVQRPVLAEVGGRLLEFCDQGDSHGLRLPGAQLAALDRFLGLETERQKMTRLYARWRRLEDEREQLTSGRAETERRLDFVRFQLDELSQLRLGDLGGLESRLCEIKEANASRELCSMSLAELGSGPNSVDARLRYIHKQVLAKGRGKSSFDSILDQVTRLLELSAELTSELQSQKEIFEEIDEADARKLEDEVVEIHRIAEKHRLEPSQLPERRQQLEREENDLLERAARLCAVEAAVREAAQAAQAQAQLLATLRSEGAPEFDRKVHAELTNLGLEHAVLETHVSEGSLGPSGTSQISIGFCANPGSDAAPLGRVASGGELARVLLAIFLAAGPAGKLLIFDEIDAGSGGETAERIGRALGRASKGGQVLCVTHWPQVAGLADSHLAIRKVRGSEAVETSVVALDEATRLLELTRMLGGSEQTARSHARRLRVVAA